MRTPQKIATILAATAIALAPLAAVSAAQAATLTDVTATSSGTIGTTGTNAFPITVTATAITGGVANKFLVNLPNGWTFVNADEFKSDGTCPSWFTTTVTSISGCQSAATSFIVVERRDSNGPLNFSTGDTASVTFAANTINVGTNRTFIIDFSDGNFPSSGDQGTATLAGGSAPTPTPAPSPAPTPTPAPDPAADSSTAATLAQTGTENGFVTPIAAALLLAAAGGAAILVRRRKA